MAIKFEKVQPGMTLLDVHSERAGNTTMRRLCVWNVNVIEVNHDERWAVVSWNGNAKQRVRPDYFKTLYAKVTPSQQKRLDAQRRYFR